MAGPDHDGEDKHVETKEEAEALIPLFKLDRVLNQDQNGRRMTLLGSIKDQPGLLTLERAAFPTSAAVVAGLLRSLSHTTNLGANDVYRWYMAGLNPVTASSSSLDNFTNGSDSTSDQRTPLAAPDLKLNLIYPCTPQHIKKYTAQRLRYVTETPEIYERHVRPWVERTQRTPARLDWIYNILDGITEQEDVIYRTPVDFDTPFSSQSASGHSKGGFILLPDLNWDRKTVTGLHLLALVQRRDLWSLRSLKRSDLEWLRAVRNLAVSQASEHARRLANQHGDTDAIDEDMLKCYVHYQPTYYHFHIHVVHVMLEPEGTTQSVGKAFSLENLISQLQHLSVLPGKDGGDAGLDQLDLSYFVGEESDLWKKCFARIKQGENVDLIA